MSNQNQEIRRLRARLADLRNQLDRAVQDDDRPKIILIDNRVAEVESSINKLETENGQ